MLAVLVNIVAVVYHFDFSTSVEEHYNFSLTRSAHRRHACNCKYLLLITKHIIRMLVFLACKFDFMDFTIMKINLCRDGVSEGQFYQVLLYELDAIRKVRIIIQSNFCSLYFMELFERKKSSEI